MYICYVYMTFVKKKNVRPKEKLLFQLKSRKVDASILKSINSLLKSSRLKMGDLQNPHI